MSPEICLKIKEARRLARLSQSVVAAEVGCKQSALSMFEQGDGTKLNEQVIQRLAKKFSVDLESFRVSRVSKGSRDSSDASDSRGSGDSRDSTKDPRDPIYIKPPVRTLGFCPNPHCPSNHAYEVDGRTLFRPDRTASDPVGGKFCAVCGESLEKKCPNCGAPVHDGAVCSFCGDTYVSVV